MVEVSLHQVVQGAISRLKRRPGRAAAAAALLGVTLLSSSALSQQPSAYRVYVANEYNADISVIDPTTDTVVATIVISGRPGEVRPRGMAVSPDGAIIYVA